MLKSERQKGALRNAEDTELRNVAFTYISNA
jgi:hypothetical protein